LTAVYRQDRKVHESLQQTPPAEWRRTLNSWLMMGVDFGL